MNLFLHTQQLFFDWFHVFSPVHIYTVLGAMLFGLIFSAKFWFSTVADIETWIFPFFISMLSLITGLFSYDLTHNLIYNSIEHKFLAISLSVLSFIVPCFIISLIAGSIIRVAKMSLFICILFTVVSTGCTGYIAKSIVHTYENFQTNLEKKAAPEQEVPY